MKSFINGSIVDDDSGWIYVNQTSSEIYARYRKIGKEVTIDIKKVSLSNRAWADFFYLPEGYRPAKTEFDCNAVSLNNPTYPIYVQAVSNGTVSISDVGGSDQSIVSTMRFFVD